MTKRIFSQYHSVLSFPGAYPGRSRNKLVLFFASLQEKIRSWSEHLHSSKGVNKITILLADDDEDDRQLFEEAISMIDQVIEVRTAKSGTELVSMLKKGDLPETIFLDLNMPGKTGKECLAEIRQHKAWRNIPVFIYSTSANKYDILDTYKGGANLYLLKPNSFPDLISMIKKAFSFDWEQTPRLEQHDFVLSTSN